MSATDINVTSNILLGADCLITTNVSNADINIDANGTGSVYIDELRFRDNKITTHITNADIQLDTDGTGLIDFLTDTQTTVGAVGAATHLPLDSANEIRPVGYLRIKVSGTEYVVPYFNAS